jgi:hypothetical protein
MMWLLCAFESFADSCWMQKLGLRAALFPIRFPELWIFQVMLIIS